MVGPRLIPLQPLYTRRRARHGGVRRLLYAGFTAGALMVAAAEAQCPVLDPANLAQNASTATQMLQTVQAVQGILSTSINLYNTIGSAGSGQLNRIFGQVQSVPGLFGNSSMTTPAISIGGGQFLPLSSLPRMVDAPVDINSILRIASPALGSGQPDFSTVYSTRQWVNGAMYSTANDPNSVLAAQARRDAAVSEAARTGYALALTTRASTAETETRAAALVTGGNAAPDERADFAALHMALTMIYSELSAVRQMRAAQLEIMSAQALRDTPTYMPAGSFSQIPVTMPQIPALQLSGGGLLSSLNGAISIMGGALNAVNTVSNLPGQVANTVNAVSNLPTQISNDATAIGNQVANLPNALANDVNSANTAVTNAGNSLDSLFSSAAGSQAAGGSQASATSLDIMGAGLEQASGVDVGASAALASGEATASNSQTSSTSVSSVLSSILGPQTVNNFTNGMNNLTNAVSNAGSGAPPYAQPGAPTTINATGTWSDDPVTGTRDVTTTINGQQVTLPASMVTIGANGSASIQYNGQTVPLGGSPAPAASPSTTLSTGVTNLGNALNNLFGGSSSSTTTTTTPAASNTGSGTSQ